MRVAVSGSHSTGKSTLIASFIARRPQYAQEPEAYEVLADDISLTESEGPDLEGLTALLEYTLATLDEHRPGASVIFERCPIDYLAYAAATQSMTEGERAEFLSGHGPMVRNALHNLDLIVLLPVSDEGPIRCRSGEDEDFRRRVDDTLRSALLDDDFGLFDGSETPRIVELSPSPDRQLEELLRRTSTTTEP